MQTAALQVVGCLYVDSKSLRNDLMPITLTTLEKIKGLLLSMARDTCLSVLEDVNTRIALLQVRHPPATPPPCFCLPGNLGLDYGFRLTRNLGLELPTLPAYPYFHPHPTTHSSSPDPNFSPSLPIEV